MNNIRVSQFTGKDGRNWTNIVFIGENNVCQWFGESEKAPIDITSAYYIDSIVTYSKYGVVNLVAEDKRAISVFAKVII